MNFVKTEWFFILVFRAKVKRCKVELKTWVEKLNKRDLIRTSINTTSLVLITRTDHSC